MQHSRQHTRRIYPGAIVHVERFPFHDDPRRSKNRYAVVVEDRGTTVRVHGIYSTPRLGRVEIHATPRTGLRHRSFIDPRRVTVASHRVGIPIGETTQLH